MPSTTTTTPTNNYFNNLLYTNEYSFCPKCGVDVTIYCHEEDCPCLRQQQQQEAAAAVTTVTETISISTAAPTIAIF